MDRIPLRRTAALFGCIAVSLVFASAVHMFGDVHGRADIFDADDAAIAEAVIAVVLAAASLLMGRFHDRARAIGLGATGFAIAGFGVGLTITAEGGHWPDIAYHLVVLPFLIGAFIVLLRSGRTRDAQRVPAAC